MFAFSQLQKTGGDTTALQIDDLTVEAGQIVALIGPAGSGKQLLQALVTGRERPSGGTVCVADLDPFAQQATLSRRLGVLFAEDRLYPRQTALANLTFYTRLLGLPKERATAVLSDIGLADQGNVRAEKLASGQARRLAFGRAILHTPDHLLLTDPFTRCDEDSIRRLHVLIREQAADGAAVFVLSASTAHLETLCHLIYPLEHGRLGPPYSPDETPETMPFKIAVRMEDRVALVNPADILYAEASDGRVYLQTTTERLATPFTLNELEGRLARQGFFRAHRSYLVNLQHVGEIIPYTRSSFSLKLNDAAATKVPLSKESAAELRDLLDY